MIFEKQPYQQDCVDRIIAALAGVCFDTGDFSLLHENIRRMAARNQLQRFSTSADRRLDVLMETGTGKTFTYLQTIFEIHKNFAQNKFIIVLPRIAIKLGVIQNIKLTRRYFFNEYKMHLSYIDYPKDGLSRIRKNFIDADDLQVLIITSGAFNSKKNTINHTDEMLARYPSVWQGVAGQRPVVIIDEPHLLKGNRTSEYLAQLDSLFIRFGATFAETSGHQLSNVVYALDSAAAFNQYLVKRIGVSTLYAEDEADDIDIRNIKAKKTFDICYSLNGQPHQKTIAAHEDIGGRTGMVRYSGVSAVKIDSRKIYLSSQRTLEASKGAYTLSDTEMTQMIRHAIELHFGKEYALFQRGIKALSLFFIPGIQDFRGDSPTVKNIFERAYRLERDKIYAQCRDDDYRRYLDRDYADGRLQVHEGYFSGDKGSAEDKESAGVNLILREKEALLSLATPLRFIFSVWALQEGWDNPNVFTICKLAATAADTSCRQQVGRGLRVAVNQSGKRLTRHCLGQNTEDFYSINTLDMVVSRREQGFIGQIQKEISDASFGIADHKLTVALLAKKGLNEDEITAFIRVLHDGKIIEFDDQEKCWRVHSSIPAFAADHKDRFFAEGICASRLSFFVAIFSDNAHVQVRDNIAANRTAAEHRTHWSSFRSLWEKIYQKSALVYRGIDEEKITSAVATRFNACAIPPAETKIVEQVYDAQTNTVSRRVRTGSRSEFFVRQDMSAFIAEFAREQRLPMVFIVKLFSKLNLGIFLHNPRRSLELLKDALQQCVHKCAIQSIGSGLCETSIYARSWQDKPDDGGGQTAAGVSAPLSGAAQSPMGYLCRRATQHTNTVSAGSGTDSDAHSRQRLTVFAVVPVISLPAPFHVCRPDFACLIEGQGSAAQMFFVAETGHGGHEGVATVDKKPQAGLAQKFLRIWQQKFPAMSASCQSRASAQELTRLISRIAP